jgi:viologen exporter family transport system permease protein
MLRQARLEAAKWMQTFQISWSGTMAYKAHFVVLVLGPTLVFFFVKYNLWTSIYAMPGVEKIQGYDLPEMLRYQFWVLVVAFLAQGYNAMNLSEDIRLGRISSYLIYPFEFWQFHTAGFLALQVLQLLVAGFTLFLVGMSGWIALGRPADALTGMLFALLAGFFWFTVSFGLGLLSFWLEETWVLRVLFVTVSTFLSGAVLPLEIYPAWLRALLRWTPFPYVTFVPVKLCMGKYSGSLLQAALAITAWTGVAALVASAIWRRGLRLYTAAGM